MSFRTLLPMPSVMDRYLAAEMLPPFLFGIGAFASVGVAVDTVFDLVRKVMESGLAPNVAWQIFFWKLPYFIGLAFPMSMLLATLMAYSRLSSDSELIALRSCGVSISRLVLPAVIMSLTVAGVSFIFQEQFVPTGNYQAEMLLDRSLQREKPEYQESNIFYPEYQEVEQSDGSKAKILTRLFYADQFDGQHMEGLTVVERTARGLDQIVVSDAAAWNPAQNVWDFFNGTSYLVSSGSSYRDISRFSHQQLPLPRTPLDVAMRGRNPGEMNIAQAQEQLEIIRLSGDDQKIRKLEVRIQEKIALPFVCVVFGLLGAVLGSKPQRAGRATSFGICVVVIFSYYFLFIICSALGIAGILSPLVAAWLPLLFGLGASGLLLRQAT